MAKHIWTVLCRQVIVDSITKNVSLLEAIDELAIAPIGPIPDTWSNLLFSATLVSFIVRSEPEVPEQCRLGIQVIGPNGDTNKPRHTIDADLISAGRARAVVQFEAIPIRGLGIHKFIISLQDPKDTDKWTVVAEIPVEYKRQPAPTAAPNQTSETTAKKVRRKGKKVSKT